MHILYNHYFNVSRSPSVDTNLSSDSNKNALNKNKFVQNETHTPNVSLKSLIVMMCDGMTCEQPFLPS